MYNSRYMRLYQTLIIALSVYSSKFVGVKAFAPLHHDFKVPIPLNPAILASYTTGRLVRNCEIGENSELNVKNILDCVVKTSVGDSILIARYSKFYQIK